MLNQSKLRTTPIEQDEVKLRALDALIANCEKAGFPFVSVYIFERTKLIDDVLRRLAELPAGGRA